MSDRVKCEWFLARIPFKVPKTEFDEFLSGLFAQRDVQLNRVRFIYSPPPERDFRGWGFVEVEIPAGADEQWLVEQFTGTEFWGLDLVVKKAKPRPPRPERTGQPAMGGRVQL